MTTDLPTAAAHAGAPGPAKRPGLAALLSSLWPGLGQLYNRQIMKGLVLIFGLPLLAQVGITDAFFGGIAALDGSEGLGRLLAGLLILVLTAAIWIYTIVDAYRFAQRLNGCHQSRVLDGV